MEDKAYLSKADGTRWAVTDVLADNRVELTQVKTGRRAAYTLANLERDYDMEKATVPVEVRVRAGDRTIKTNLSRIASFIHDTARTWNYRAPEINRDRLDQVKRAIDDLEEML